MRDARWIRPNGDEYGCGRIERTVSPRFCPSAFGVPWPFHRVHDWTHVPRDTWWSLARNPCFWCEPILASFSRSRVRDQRFAVVGLDQYIAAAAIHRSPG